MHAYATRPEKMCRRQAQHGLTLVELMISIVLGLLVVLAATALFLASTSSYTSQDQESIVSDTGRYAIENIARSLRQAAFENWDTEASGSAIPQAPIVSTPDMSANLVGMDNTKLTNFEQGLASAAAGGVNGSDVLAVRFFGVGDQSTGSISTDGFGSIVDCAGLGVPAPASQDVAESQRGWSIYYVGKDGDDVPELRCLYRGGNAWAVVAFARGVESFQVLYGLDTDADRIPNQYLTATQVTARDVGLDEADLNRKTNWKKVVSVKVALLVRGEQNVQGDVATMAYNLFGDAYSNANGEKDTGTTVAVSTLATGVQRRVRQQFQTTVQYRNAVEGSGYADSGL